MIRWLSTPTPKYETSGTTKMAPSSPTKTSKPSLFKRASSLGKLIALKSTPTEEGKKAATAQPAPSPAPTSSSTGADLTMSPALLNGTGEDAPGDTIVSLSSSVTTGSSSAIQTASAAGLAGGRPSMATSDVESNALPQRTPKPSTRRRVVDSETKKDLRSRLKARLAALSSGLVINDGDLEKQLEASGYHLERAASDFMERAGLRTIQPGTTIQKVEQDSPSTLNSWSYCSPSRFSVRCGPNYRKSRSKAPAAPEAIYDVISVDMYASPKKMEDLSRFMMLGDLETTSHLGLPELFIVNFMLPTTEPRMPLFGSAVEQDGPTVCFYFIMRLSQWAKKNPDHASVKLYKRFLTDSGPQGLMRERLKIIVQVANPDELNLGRIERGLYRQYNGLPFLYRQYNSTYKSGMGWFQADFDGHRSGYATRFARFALLSFSKGIVANCGFLVESELDEEMPERMLGCATIHRFDCANAQTFQAPTASACLSPMMRPYPDFYDSSTQLNESLSRVGSVVSDFGPNDVLFLDAQDGEEEEEEEENARGVHRAFDDNAEGAGEGI